MTQLMESRKKPWLARARDHCVGYMREKASQRSFYLCAITDGRELLEGVRVMAVISDPRSGHSGCHHCHQTELHRSLPTPFPGACATWPARGPGPTPLGEYAETCLRE